MHTSNNNPTSKLTLAAIIMVTAALTCLPSLAEAVSWQELTPEEQQILAPLSNEWNSIPKKRQNSYIEITKRYTQLTPLKQKRFQEQLVRWAKLTPAQRKKAREKYKSLTQLTPQKREIAKQVLREQNAQKHPDAASAALPAAPALKIP